MSESLSALVEGLASPVREVRLHCMERLAQAGKPAVAPLCGAVSSGALLARCAAAEALGRIGDRAATPVLVKALQDAETTVQERAATALGRLRDPAAVPALCAAARGGSVFVAPPALEALGEIGDPRALPTLARVLNGMGVETALRMAAAQALGKMGHPGAVRPLLEALGTSYTGLFVEVCRALARIKSPEAVPALCGAAEHAGRLDASHLAIAALCEALEIAARLGYPEAAPVAFEAPQHFGAHALPALAVVLEKGSAGAKVRALELLQGFGSTEAAAWEMVAGSLRDRQEPVRLAALLTLTRCPEASFELRARPLLEDASRRVRAMAAVALYGWEPAPDLLPGVLEALGDPDPLVVTAAAAVLERCARERPAAYLREAILPLRRRSGSLFRRLPAEAQRACRGALKAVERATAGVRDLPLPSTSRTSSADLPRPAQPAPPEPEGLPIPQPGKGLPG